MTSIVVLFLGIMHHALEETRSELHDKLIADLEFGVGFRAVTIEDESGRLITRKARGKGKLGYGTF